MAKKIDAIFCVCFSANCIFSKNKNKDNNNIYKYVHI